MYDFVITGIAKDENLYLEEWICFHRAVGASHAFIYDNNSAIPISISMKKYIDAGWITVIDWPQPGGQMNAYTHFIKTFGDQCKWAAIIDVDEYFLPKKHNNIPDALNEFNLVGALAVNWKLFGSNNHITKPDGLTIENFTIGSTKLQAANKHIKSVIQPARTLKAWKDPHSFVYKEPYFAVNEHNQYVNGPFNKEISWDIFQINHYVVRSLAEFEIKIKRTRADIPDRTVPGRRIEEFEDFNKHPEEDKSALKWLEQTKALML